jgi:asparagine synthase (glutamine-hydrolysing)
MDGVVEPVAELWAGSLAKDFPGVLQRCQMVDTLTYLPDDILVKVDRASMGVSLEARAPLLDHRVFEAAWRLPEHLKVRNGVSKWALREILYRHVPRSIVERPKMGFGVPIDYWLRGPLKGWAEDLLDEGRLRREGYLEPSLVRGAWAAHQAGQSNVQHKLWAVLMFQSWLAEGRGAGAIALESRQAPSAAVA